MQRPVMIQATSSNAGKSILAAGLCRLLARRGVKCAPFKAQNMSLNSFVTGAGEEMGRAQALQAAACGEEPSALMNPVLLKPLGEHLSQIILLGKPLGIMSYAEYLKMKARLWREVKKAWGLLSKDYEIVIIEGAGSPAEINLRRHDIVNMAVARFTGARVVLTADIDRGGAFAALAGTMALLGRADRSTVAGFILNKFRGDRELLAPAIAKISLRLRRPFFGVMPMLSGLRLPDEDSVSFMEGRSVCLSGKSSEPCLIVGLIAYPGASNLTDVDALAGEPRVRVVKMEQPEDIGDADLLILPGTRNTGAALDFLLENDFPRALAAYARRALGLGRGALVGICGGLQILGRSLEDPASLEPGRAGPGLGLLPLDTVLEKKKVLKRGPATAFACLGAGEKRLEGYEIHHGRSKTGGAVPVMTDAAGLPIGWTAPQWLDSKGVARVWGAYLHGLFDADCFRHAFLARMREEAGLKPENGLPFSLGPELDRLADQMEENLDVTGILGPGVEK